MAKSSLFVRALIAVVLLLGFYVLALGIGLGLLTAAYGLFDASIKGAFACAALGGTVLWALLPRRDRFQAPGPEITEVDNPELFAVIRKVAKATAQEMPSDVYLVPDVNAFVTQRGGVMGFFSKRVMGLGLPLLTLLTVSELEAVLAHEFGHYHGGDTRLGPWIYNTRAAIARTVISLAHSGSTVIRKPFEWYGILFLRVTHAISRSQELAADALAARVVGPEHLIAGLKVVHGGGAAYQTFLRTEYGPVIEAGYLAPLAEGFHRFMMGEKLRGAIDRFVDEEIEFGQSNAYDTHPPLNQRIGALEGLAKGEVEPDRRRAIELVGDPELEAELIFSVEGRGLKRLDWSRVAERVQLPRWRTQSSAVAIQLSACTLGELPMSYRGLSQLAARILKGEVSEMPDREAHFGAEMAGAAVCATLCHHGWQLQSRVGRPVVLRRGEIKLRPFRDFHRVVDGQLSATKLKRRLVDAGVADLRVVRNSVRPGVTAATAKR
ncbi:MAG: M48 family metalloprotease [Polyangiaceae bacterium]